MSLSCPLADSLFAEHRALCREYAAVQARCSRLIAQQRAQIECLQAQVVRLRAAAIVQVSVRAFVRQRPAPDQRMQRIDPVGQRRRTRLQDQR